MSWSRKQKFLVHMYAAAAELPDQHYRQILFEVSGCRSAKHPALTQFHFDQVMAKLEARLDYAVAEGLVEAPPRDRIADLQYWRRRLPATGAENSRHAHRIAETWDQLRPYLPEDQRTDDYLLGIARFACQCQIPDLGHLQAWQASRLIDALKDRLAHAVRRGGVAA
jgi:hypothetical protein